MAEHGCIGVVKSEYVSDDSKLNTVIGWNRVPVIQPKDTKITGSKKPPMSYIGLISMAIQSSSGRKMLLSDIYQWIVNNYPYYKMSDRSWRNSVRHNLSLNECFIKCGRSENGKSHYWTIHPANMHCFSTGDFRRRHARQLVRKCDDDLERLCNNADDVNKAIKHDKFLSPQGFIPMTCRTVSVDYIKATFGENVLRTDISGVLPKSED